MPVLVSRCLLYLWTELYGCPGGLVAKAGKIVAEAYIAGDPTRPDGVIVQGGSDPGELMSFGSDAAVLWELLRLVEGWSYPPSHRAKG